MIKGRVSIIIPSRNEAYLQATIDDLLAKAEGDLEIIPVLDGRMADGQFQPVVEHPQVKPLRKVEPEGMRPAINDAAQLATGEFLMKCDAHVILGERFDTILKADCDVDWFVVPTRHSINVDAWTMKRRDFNYSLITYPFLGSMYGEGFHAVTFAWDKNPSINQQRAHLPIDDILSAQGSLWFQRREYFLRFPPLDHAAMYFYQEAQETMFRVLATGGRCIVNKQTSYGHYHKGKENRGADGRQGRGFYLDLRKKRAAEATMVEWCLNGWPAEWKATRTFESMIDQHWWLISQMTDPRYAWPSDWRDWEKHRKAFAERAPEHVPAHT